MKKFWLLVAAMLTVFSLSVVYASDIIIHIKADAQTARPRSELPVISARIAGSICQTEIRDYTGRVSISVETTEGDTLITQTESVCDSIQFDTDVSSLIDGEYTITYTLEDSTIFCGEFEK